MYTLDDLHYNSKNIVQVSPTEAFEDLSSTLVDLDNELKRGSQLELNMLSFFHREVEPLDAYKDNNIDQGEEGPRRLHVVGKLKKLSDDLNLFVRLGIRSPGENQLIPSLQVLYLQSNEHTKYIAGETIGTEQDSDRWFYDFTDRYQGMVKGVYVITRLGIKSLSVIPLINEVLLSDTPRELEAPKYQ